MSSDGPFGGPPPGSTPPPPSGGTPPPPPGGFGSPPPPPSGGYGAPPPAPGGFGAPPPAPGGYPPPGGYGAPGYGAPAANPTNGMAIAALVCGILSLFCLFPLGFVGVGLGVAGLGKAKKTGGSGKGLAIGGIVTGAIGILATLAFVALIIFGGNSDGGINSDPSDGICNRTASSRTPTADGVTVSGGARVRPRRGGGRRRSSRRGPATTPR